MEIIDDAGAQVETRECRTCGVVGHIARDCPNKGAPKTPGTCRTCGELGHIARDCPQKATAKETRDCRICGEIGHIARDCPKKGDADAPVAAEGGGRRGGSRSSRSSGLAGRRCFNCGKTGHLSAECEVPAGASKATPPQFSLAIYL
jgi:cellular nucleic acid-binding protein